MSEEMYNLPANAPTPDPFERFNNPDAVNEAFADIFGLEELGPATVIEGVGRLAVDANLTDGTYADHMNAQAAAAGIAPLTAENIEDEVFNLYTAFNVGEIVAEQQRLLMDLLMEDDDEGDGLSEAEKRERRLTGRRADDDLALVR